MECGLGLFPLAGQKSQWMSSFLERSEKPHNCGLSREPMVLRLGLGFMVRLSINHFLIIYIYIWFHLSGCYDIRENPLTNVQW